MARTFMRVFGVIFLLLGIGGYFLPTEGALHNLLHLTGSHNLIHLLSGVVFLAVSNNEKYSKWVATIFGVVYGLVAILGLFMDDVFGLVMVTWLTEVIHFVVAALALYVGLKSSASDQNQNQSHSA